MSSPPHRDHNRHGEAACQQRGLADEKRPDSRQTYRFLTPFDVCPAHVERRWSTINNRFQAHTKKREKYDISCTQLYTIQQHQLTEQQPEPGAASGLLKKCRSWHTFPVTSIRPI